MIRLINLKINVSKAFKRLSVLMSMPRLFSSITSKFFVHYLHRHAHPTCSASTRSPSLTTTSPSKTQAKPSHTKTVCFFGHAKQGFIRTASQRKLLQFNENYCNYSTLLFHLWNKVEVMFNWNSDKSGIVIQRRTCI